MRSLPPIPANTPIADPKDGTITSFFRRRWQELSDGWDETGTVGSIIGGGLAQTGPLPTTRVFTAVGSGTYRVSWYLRKTIPDGAASSATVTIGWVDVDGTVLSFTGPALTLDSGAAVQSGTILARTLQNRDITVAVAYSSTTPNKMQYDLEVHVEQVT